MKLFILFIIVAIGCKDSQKVFRQNDKSFSDTVRFCQIQSPWVSTCFDFYKKNNESTNGFFEKTMESDDGQLWYGKGTFKEDKSKIVLSEFLLFRTLNNIKDTSKIEPMTFVKNKDSLILNDVQTDNKIIFLKQK